ncbi:gene transfer agent family protein [Rhizobium sp. TH2]|uniref:gene transfer agent family protein n=1 Tax=Rhizobium sp. TH2 TaxID=2775403 RepID=UPI0021576B3B|nr:gene transfer agent family protein [Rhizobium sp. TH2]UVC10190.1 gene transfer agent family protein [Rhizobium sp. TH2]
MKHTAYFGDATYTFALTDDMILELENKTGLGIAGFYLRMSRAEWSFEHMVELIRLGLIGGGTSPAVAQRLVDTYAKNRVIDETFPLAFDIIDARWTGKPEEVAA